MIVVEDRAWRVALLLALALYATPLVSADDAETLARFHAHDTDESTSSAACANVERATSWTTPARDLVASLPMLRADAPVGEAVVVSSIGGRG